MGKGIKPQVSSINRLVLCLYSKYTDGSEFLRLLGGSVGVLSEICPALIRQRLSASVNEPLQFIGHLSSSQSELISLRTFLVSRIQDWDRNPTPGILSA